MSQSKVVLKHELGGFHDAVLIERIDASSAAAAEDSWAVFLAVARAEAAAAGRHFAPLAHEHWQWREKVTITEKLLPYPTMGIECRKQMQGMMLLETDGQFSRIKEGAPLVYVNLIATAPWNLASVVKTPRYKGVGTTLVGAAIATSKDLGFAGRVGLHAIPSSEPWYEKHGFKKLGYDSTKKLNYYELTAAKADEFLN